MNDMKAPKVIKLIFSIVIGIILIFFAGILKRNRISNKQNIISKIYKTDDLIWYENNFYGLIFNSPFEKLAANNEIYGPIATGVKETKINSIVANDIVFFLLYIDTEFLDYDLDIGLSESIYQMVSSFEGAEVTLELDNKHGDTNQLFGNGNFVKHNKNYLLKAFLVWNDRKKMIRSIIAFGQNNSFNRELLEDSFKSIDVFRLRREESSVLENIDKRRDQRKSNEKLPSYPTYEEFKKQIEESKTSKTP